MLGAGVENCVKPSAASLQVLVNVHDMQLKSFDKMQGRSIRSTVGLTGGPPPSESVG
jgi:hypothetical protein